MMKRSSSNLKCPNSCKKTLPDGQQETHKPPEEVKQASKQGGEHDEYKLCNNGRILSWDLSECCAV
jgi:hypothetical protein